MKYLGVCLAVLLISFNVAAQIEKGKNIVSGNFNLDYWHFSQPGIKTSTWNPGLGLEIHHFIRSGLTLGLELNGSYFSQAMKFTENGASRPSRGYGLSVVPQVRKYWKVLPFFVYAGAGLSLAANSSLTYFRDEDVRYSESRYKTFNLIPQARLGLIYPLTKRLSIEAAGISDIYPASFNRLQLGLVLLASEGHSSVSEAVKAVSALTAGRWVISGTFNSSLAKGSNYDEETNESYRNPATLVQVGTGIFMPNRVLIGADITLGFRGSAINDRNSAGWMGTGSSKPWSIGIRPYLRKYMTAMHLTPYWEVSANYSRIMAGVDPTHTYSAGGQVGLAYVLGKHWILHAKLAGLTVGYSKLPDNESEVATLLGGEKISAAIDAGLRPALTIAYSFK